MSTSTIPEWLTKGSTIPLPAEGKSFEQPLGNLDITRVDGTRVSLAFRYTDDGVEHTITCADHDLAVEPLTLGKTPDKTMQLPDKSQLVDAANQDRYTRMSRLHATIFLEHGVPTYRHEATNQVRNPDYALPPEMVAAIPPEAGNGGGYTHENRVPNNTRSGNEDRGLAHRGLPLKDDAAIEYLRRTVAEFIVPQTHTHRGGSTLSIAMRTKDKHFACSFLGDSPIYILAQHKTTGEMDLLQVGLPHTGYAHKMKEGFAKMDLLPPMNFNYAKEFIATNAPALAAQINVQEPGIVGITKCLGQMGNARQDPDKHVSEQMLIKPDEMCPSEYNFKGIMVCSDGVYYGVEYKLVQKALTELFAKDAKPSPEVISETVVNAARPYSNDNITATMLPAEGKAGDLIAVADGNTGTAEVAELAIRGLRAQCENKFVPYTVKKDKQYRISLQGNLVEPGAARQWLELLAANFRSYDTEHAFQMGTRVVRETLVVTNPTNKVRNYLDSIIRGQNASADRGLI